MQCGKISTKKKQTGTVKYVFKMLKLWTHRSSHIAKPDYKWVTEKSAKLSKWPANPFVGFIHKDILHIVVYT